MPDLAFKLLAKEPLVAVLRSGHRLAALAWERPIPAAAMGCPALRST